MNQKEMQEREAVLEDFEVLASYVREGYLEAVPARGEVYITLPAIHCLAGNLEAVKVVEEVQENMGTQDFDVIYRSTSYDGARFRKAMKEINDNLEFAAGGLRLWCWWLNAANEGFKEYLKDVGDKDGALRPEADEDTILLRARDIVRDVQRGSVAVHVVEEEMPHHLKCTILVERVRRWWCPFTKRDKFTMINY